MNENFQGINSIHHGDDNNENDDEQQNILQIQKYDSRSLIFNDNDSFIANEEQAMREDAENELKIQDLQFENSQLQKNLNDALDEKSNLVEQLNAKNSEIEKLNATIEQLQNDQQASSFKISALNRQLTEQQNLNSDLSLQLQELTEALNDKNKSPDGTSDQNASSDQLIYRLRALELQLASHKRENEELKEEIDTREKKYIEELSRLSTALSDAHKSNPGIIINSNLPNESLNENEVAALRSQIDMMAESQKTLSESLQQQIESNANLSSELTDSQKKLEANLKENSKNNSVINSLLEITNLSDPFDLISNVRNLQVKESESEQARQQLCQLQISYDQEVIINQNLRSELSQLQNHFLEELSSDKEKTANSEVKDNDELTFNQSFINELKSDYESRLSAERARTSLQRSKIDAIVLRDKQISERFASVPISDHTDMIQSLIAIFEALSNNSENIKSSNDASIDASNDRRLNTVIEESQDIALKLVPQEYMFSIVEKIKYHQQVLDEINEKTQKLSERFGTLYKRAFKPNRQFAKPTQFQKIPKPPSQSPVFINRNGVTVNRKSTFDNNDSTFNFNLNPNNSSFNLSRSPAGSGLNPTPKSGKVRIPLSDRKYGMTSNTSWEPRNGPSNFVPENFLTKKFH